MIELLGKIIFILNFATEPIIAPLLVGLVLLLVDRWLDD
ncbi:type I toxin-antitoxin system Fst family toxin [Enterococcus faecalis]|nr:type I toxin-antitoxin system Fst family toxin [Enterococcus faecalis]